MKLTFKLICGLNMRNGELVKLLVKVLVVDSVTMALTII